MAVALAVGTVAAVAMLSVRLLLGFALALAVFAAVRVPVLYSRGTARLVSDAAASAVRRDFESATPPMLSFQWGVADTVSRTDREARYELSYFFGLRSVTMTCALEDAPADGTGVRASDALVLRVTAGGRPWATYEVEIDERDEQTVVDVTWKSDRRFGLRAVPQWLVARRYRSEALAAQGYAIEGYEHSFTP